MGDAGTDARPEAGPVTGASPAGDQEPGTRRSGTGRKARVAAMRTADTLRERGIAAAALFKLSMGGWIVRVYLAASGGEPGMRSRRDVVCGEDRSARAAKDRARIAVR